MGTWENILPISALCISLLTLNVVPAFAAEALDRIQTSEANYQRIFGEEDIAIAETDPEFAATMKRYIYGDIAAQAKLTNQQRELVSIAVLATLQDNKLLRKEVRGALHTGVTPLEIRETMYQIAPYIGFSKTVEAIENMNDVFKAEHIRLPLPEQGTVTEQNRLEQGMAVQKSIYGEYIDQMRAAAPADQKALQDDLSAFCFGDTYTRGTLDLKMRELLTLSVIAALGGAEPQLKGHIQGNVNVGNDRKTILGAITQCMPYIGFPRTLNALRCFNEVLPLK